MPEMTKAGAEPTVAGRGQNLRATGAPSRTHSITSLVYAQGHVVGHIGADGWLVKAGLDPRKHKKRAPPGWATDTAHLLIPGMKGVRLVLHDGARLDASIALWRRYGRPFNQGYGEQTLLVDEHWTVWRPGEAQAEQLSLW